MHTVRNRTAMSRSGGEFRHVSKASVKQASTATPAFPDQVRIPPRKGAVIRDAPLPEPQALAEAALILPAPKLPPLPGTTRPATIKPGKAVGKRGQKTRRRKPAARTARPKRSKAKAAKALPLALVAELRTPAPETTLAPAPNIAAPPLPRSRSLVDTRRSGIVSKVVRWLDALSMAIVGQPLSGTTKRKHHRFTLPAPRQSLAQAAAGRCPPSRQAPSPSGGAGDELARLRLENARLKAELARLAG